jgi:hypothetical protein
MRERLRGRKKNCLQRPDPEHNEFQHTGNAEGGNSKIA